MIEELADRNSFYQRRGPAGVVAVEVRDENVIDLLQPGHLCDLEDSLRVAIVRQRTAGIGEQGLTGRRNDQGAAATLHVYEVNL